MDALEAAAKAKRIESLQIRSASVRENHNAKSSSHSI